MSNDNIIEFISKDCKNHIHPLCHGKWSGLGFNVVCECECHKTRDCATEEFSSQSSVTAAQIHVDDEGDEKNN